MTDDDASLLSVVGIKRNRRIRQLECLGDRLDDRRQDQIGREGRFQAPSHHHGSWLLTVVLLRLGQLMGHTGGNRGTSVL